MFEDDILMFLCLHLHEHGSQMDSLLAYVWKCNQFTLASKTIQIYAWNCPNILDGVESLTLCSVAYLQSIYIKYQKIALSFRPKPINKLWKRGPISKQMLPCFFFLGKSCVLCNWPGRTLWPDNHVLGRLPWMYTFKRTPNTLHTFNSTFSTFYTFNRTPNTFYTFKSAPIIILFII